MCRQRLVGVKNAAIGTDGLSDALSCVRPRLWLTKTTARLSHSRSSCAAPSSRPSARWIRGCCAVLGDESLVRRHVLSTLGHYGPYVVQRPLRLIEGQRVGPRVVA